MGQSLSDPNADERRINLARARVLIADTSHSALGVMSQVLGGFGVASMTKTTGSRAAFDLLGAEPFDLAFIDANLPGDMNGLELVHRLRRDARSPNQQMAIVLTCGHVQASHVRRARDCGVSLIIAKPVSPAVVLKRIQWLAHDRRDFVDCGDIYVGPDRRFHAQPEPPKGVLDRRGDDGAATGAESPRGDAG